MVALSASAAVREATASHSGKTVPGLIHAENRGASVRHLSLIHISEPTRPY